MKALEIKNLKKTYNNDVTALKGIDLSVDKGDFLRFLVLMGLVNQLPLALFLL